MINYSYKKCGGLHFLKLGRLTFMFCLSRAFKPVGKPHIVPRSHWLTYDGSAL